MRYFLIALFFAAQLLSACTVKAEVVGTFTPLKDNETFAFYSGGIAGANGNVTHFDITMYAVRNNNPDDLGELFTMENMDDYVASVQFTGDFRTAFLLAKDGTFYMATGSTGEIKKLRTAVRSPVFRITEDGRFGAFVKEEWGKPEAYISVFDIETETMRQLTWKLNRRIEGTWDIGRYNGVFFINGTYERGGSQALAELDPSTMELTTFYDRTNRTMTDHRPSDITPPPSVITFLGDVIDDICRQYDNPDIRLWLRWRNAGKDGIPAQEGETACFGKKTSP